MSAGWIPSERGEERCVPSLSLWLVDATFMLTLCRPVSKSTLFIMAPGLPYGLDGKESACNAGDLGSLPGSGRSPAEGDDYSLLCSYLESPTARGAWWATVHGFAKSRT